MKWRVPGQEVDQRKLGERLWKKTDRFASAEVGAMACVVYIANRWFDVQVIVYIASAGSDYILC